MLEHPQILLPNLHLVYATPDLPLRDEKRISEEIISLRDNPPGGKIETLWHLKESHKCLGQVRFDEHEIQIAGLPDPLPPGVIDRTIHVSLWQPQIRAAMRHHRAHLSLVYTGEHPDPVEKMIALYQTAQAFANENLLGIVNENAWTAHPPADFLTPEKIRSFKQEIPFILWVGYVKYFIDKDRYWLVTRGHHIFDVPDLAYFIQPGESANKIINRFINIFYYIYEQDVVVTAGDTLSIGETGDAMKFSDVTEHTDLLMGPAGTLVVEKISPNKTHS